ncbi:MAG: hypothetical protein KC486_25825, partial [Myxococcales bacterium]|nr:hypothetical protein [Myxococcales bacterium]
GGPALPRINTTSEGRTLQALAGCHEHLLLELERVAFLVRAQVWRARQVADADHPYRGHFIPEAEVDALLARPDALPEWVRREAPLPPVELRRVLDRIEAIIDARARAALQAGHRPPLLALRNNFALDRFQYDAFLFALAVELDSRFERLYAYLHDDVSRRRPSVDLLLNLGCSSAAERLRRRRDFTPEGVLLRAGLLVWEADPNRAGGSSRLVGSLRVPEAVVDFLTASEPRPSCGELVNTPRPLSAWFGPDDVRARLRAVADELRTPSLEPATSAHQPGATTICLRGSHGCGRRTAAEGIAESLGRPLLVVDLPAERSEEHVTEARRDAGLWGALLLWRWSAETLPPSAVASRGGSGIPRRIEFIAAPVDAPPLPQSRYEHALELSLPPLSTTSRRCVWERALAPLGDTEALDLDTLASRFRFGGDKIAQVAASLAGDDRERAEPLAAPAIYAASRRHSRVAVAGLASHITPRRSWPDLILAADIEEQLRLIERRVRHRTTVLETWGLGARMPEARGTHALFAGPPGTGKTLAA